MRAAQLPYVALNLSPAWFFDDALIITACFLSAAGNTRPHAEYAMVDFYRWGNAKGLEPVLPSLFYCGGEDTQATTCVCA